MWRKATILSDATLCILSEGADFTGHALLDDEYLEYKGLSYENGDFVPYRYNPEVEPPRALAAAESGDPEVKGYSLKRGSIARLGQDKLRSKF